MKLKTKTKNCQLIVRAKVSFGETINETELDIFSRGYLRGFLKPKMIKKNMIEYVGPVGISLFERLKRPVVKRDFLFILEQIVVAVQRLQENGRNLSYLVTDLHHVYINEVTKELQFMYLPADCLGDQMRLEQLVESIVYSIQPAEEQDQDYVSRFLLFFRCMIPFDINQIEAFVMQEDRNIVNILKKQMVGQSGFMTSKQQHYYEHYDKKQQEESSMEDEDNTALLDDDEATGLLCEDVAECGEDEETGLLSDWEEGTALLEDSAVNVRYGTLCRVSTNEMISVNQPVFRLGKDPSCAHYPITNNSTVSRNHADIITRGSQYFVMDLNSKNHTYVNNEMISPQNEVAIQDGDHLRLANEEFIFYL